MCHDVSLHFIGYYNLSRVRSGPSHTLWSRNKCKETKSFIMVRDGSLKFTLILRYKLQFITLLELQCFYPKNAWDHCIHSKLNKTQNIKNPRFPLISTKKVWNTILILLGCCCAKFVSDVVTGAHVDQFIRDKNQAENHCNHKSSANNENHAKIGISRLSRI